MYVRYDLTMCNIKLYMIGTSLNGLITPRYRVDVLDLVFQNVMTGEPSCNPASGNILAVAMEQLE